MNAQHHVLNYNIFQYLSATLPKSRNEMFAIKGAFEKVFGWDIITNFVSRFLLSRYYGNIHTNNKNLFWILTMQHIHELMKLRRGTF